MSDIYYISDSKFQLELIPFTLDFTEMMQVGDSIPTSGVTVLVTVLSGIDPAPSAILYNLPDIVGNVLTQNIRQGVEGVIYEIDFLVTTTYGMSYNKKTTLAILPMTGNVVPHFTPEYLTSQPYPYFYLEPYKVPTPFLLSGTLVLAVQTYTYFEKYQTLPTFVSGTLFDIYVYYNNWIPEKYQTYPATFVSGTITLQVIYYNNWVPDQYKTSAHFFSGTLINAFVYYSNWVPDQYQTARPTFIGGTLV